MTAACPPLDSPSLASLDDELLARLCVARAHGVGARTAALLHDLAGSHAALLALPAAELERRGVPARVVAALRDPSLPGRARAELDRLRGAGGTLLGIGLPGYPEALATIHDPPLTLGMLGALQPEDRRAVAIVGARRATPAGLEVARALGHDLAAAGLTVLSGLARGIDQAAHEGALSAGGRTIAVLGSGVLAPWPPNNRGLAERIARQGAVLSELEPDAEPRRHTFPQRNRIVAGMALGVVVVEAGPRSGALITADMALQEGRELFAVPGSILEPLARGPNRLLRDGARLVESAQDVLDVLVGVTPRSADLVAPEGTDEDPPAPRDRPAPGAPRAPDRVPPFAPIGEPDLRVAAELDPTRPTPVEELARATGLPAAEIMRALGRLELAGRAAPLGGAGYVGRRR